MKRNRDNTQDQDEFYIDKSDRDFKPYICKLNMFEYPNINSKLDFSFKSTIPYPKGMYGFQHFLHQSRQKLRDQVKKFEGKKQVYTVCDKFNDIIDDYDDTIKSSAEKLFGETIISKNFYKMWEVLCVFDLVKASSVSCNLAELQGEYLQAILLFQNKYIGSKSSGNHYCISFNHKSIGKSSINSSLSKHKNVEVFDDYPKNFDKEYYGDLTNVDIRNKFINFVKNKADIITANNTFQWSDDVLQEQESFPIILADFITTLHVQKKGGHFICKFYETFTELTIKLIILMSEMYNNTYIYKPLISEKYSPEKFLIFSEFKDDSKKKQLITNLESLLNNIIINIEKKPPNFINDYFLSYEVPKIVKLLFIESNNHINNGVYQNINEIVAYINRENYRGDEYQQRRDEQIIGTKFWISHFLQDKYSFTYFKDLFYGHLDIVKNKVDELSKVIE